MQRFPYGIHRAFKSRPLLSPFQFRRTLGTETFSPNDPLPLSTAGVRLREYQEECIQSILSYVSNGHKRLGVSLATGSGKTVIFTQLIDRIKPRDENATKTLILAHRRELVEQAARHCENAYPSKIIEVEMADCHASGIADITVASVPSIISGARLLKFDPKDFKLVLVDEAHHIVAASFMEALDHFKLLKPALKEDSPTLVGVSATFSRHDGLRLSDAIDYIVYHKDYVDMIGEKWLSDVRFTTVQSKADVSRVKKGPGGDFQPGDLSKAVNTDRTNEIAVRAWLAQAKERKSTLGFCVDLAHVEGLTSLFRRHGVDARRITSRTPKKDRGERLDAFKKGEFPVLLNCGVFTEGTDIPNIDCVLLARPTRSRNLLVQMMGRGLRLHPGKQDCHVIDMVASLDAGIVTTPTLFGLDPDALVKDVSVEEMRSKREQKELEQPRENLKLDPVKDRSLRLGASDQKLTFTNYDSVNDLIEDDSSDRYIRGVSQLAWVAVSQGRYVLANINGDYLTIELTTAEPTPRFSVMLTQKLTENESLRSTTKFRRPRKIGLATNLTDAIHAADTYAKEKFTWAMVNWRQGWRYQPATPGQLKFLEKTKISTHRSGRPQKFTKGQANDLITKIKFGARGAFQRVASYAKKQQKTMDAVSMRDAMLQHGGVKVGPVAGV